MHLYTCIREKPTPGVSPGPAHPCGHAPVPTCEHRHPHTTHTVTSVFHALCELLQSVWRSSVAKNSQVLVPDGQKGPSLTQRQHCTASRMPCFGQSCGHVLRCAVRRPFEFHSCIVFILFINPREYTGSLASSGTCYWHSPALKSYFMGGSAVPSIRDSCLKFVG